MFTKSLEDPNKLVVKATLLSRNVAARPFLQNMDPGRQPDCTHNGDVPLAEGKSAVVPAIDLRISCERFLMASNSKTGCCCVFEKPQKKLNRSVVSFPESQ